MTRAWRAAWVLLVVPACFHPSYDHPACGPNRECPAGLSCSAQSICEVDLSDAASDSDLSIDAATDGASLDGTVAAVCLGTFVNVCVDPPQAPTMLTNPIDTGTSNLCAAYTANPPIDACVITGTSVAIAAGITVSATGTKPLILFSTDGITVSGVLDVASHQGKPSGPAGDTGPCPTTGFTNPTQGTQGGGGWGGSFGTAGGDGGNGVTGIGGISPPAFTTTTLRGGCPGSNGASNGLGNGGGGRGHGGGAVLLLAGQTITIDGTVNASGAGGLGGGSGFGGGAGGGGGGGGGGSGGMIVLQAAVVNTPGQCFANGGGGGEGSSLAGGNTGGESTAPSSAGNGGNVGSPTGGDGGAGAFGTTGSSPGRPGAPKNNDDGGGGAGGGGAGIIKVIAPEQHNTSDPNRVAPPPS